MTGAHPIVVQDLSKAFRVYTERNQSVKQMLLNGRKARYQEFWALDDVSFSVPESSTFGVLGSNGAGKSTLLKLLAQILVPDRGSVSVTGRVSALLELGAGFHPDLSGRENVFLNGSVLGLSRRVLRSKLDEIVEFANLEAFIDNPVKTYSSGMYARLGFAVAVNVDPDVLLIDEVLAVGDEVFQRKCAEKIAELRSGGRTVLIVSHSMGSLQTMCDQAAWIDHGRLAAVGPTAYVIDQYIAAVHPTGTVDDEGRVRIGTGVARVNCDVASDRGRFITSLNPFHIRFRISSSERLQGVALQFTLKRTDGVVIGGSTTRNWQVALNLEKGENTVDYSVGENALLAGSYEVSTFMYDVESQVTIDGCDHLAKFEVDPSVDGIVRFGIIDLCGKWNFDVSS
jgi:ABC-type polysaccharide/polyol phosphate transport system ATPase subunit